MEIEAFGLVQRRGTKAKSLRRASAHRCFIVETNVDRKEKSELVAALHEQFSQANLVVVTHNNGLTVAEITNLRQKIRASGAKFKVTKNRLTRLALADTKFEGLDSLFTGPTAVAYSADPVAAAKVVVDFAKGNEKLVILGGSLGTSKLDVEGIKALATLPSLDELRAKMLGMIQTPATRIAGILQAPGGQVARVLAAYAKKDEAA
jgi:large subunit ribosomal protein L10